MLFQSYQKVKEFASANKNDIILTCVIVAVSIIGFAIGRISTRVSQERQAPLLEAPAPNNNELSASEMKKETPHPASNIQNATSGNYVASKNGLLYYAPFCSGAARIKPENKIWFQTKQEAESRGYKPATNCPGL